MDNGQQGSSGNRFAIITSILSLVVAMFGAGHTVLRAQIEDEGALRTEVAESVRRLSQLPRSASGERGVILAQLATAIQELDDPPSGYLRELSVAYRSNSYYRRSIDAAHRAIAISRRERDAVGEAVGLRVLAGAFRSAGHLKKMRRAYLSAITAAKSTRAHPLETVTLDLYRARLFGYWAESEGTHGSCKLAKALLARSYAGAKRLPTGMSITSELGSTASVIDRRCARQDTGRGPPVKTSTTSVRTGDRRDRQPSP